MGVFSFCSVATSAKLCAMVLSSDSSKPITVLPIFGTRPEAVKMAPLVNLLKARPEFHCVVGVTAQHRQILDQILEFFNIVPEHDLNIMLAGQTLAEITTRALTGLDDVFKAVQPDIVLAQGDTTTVLAAALASAYHKIPFGHVEAGLRTDNLYDPFPEEINRRLTSQITQLHFAPTQMARENLLREGVASKGIFLTGNTVIDALLQVVNRPEAAVEKTAGERLILVTTHRRENWGKPQENIALALHEIIEKFPDTRAVLPMHPNPIVREPLVRVLGNHPRVELTEPMDYVDLVKVMKRAHLVLTDSGGVQEEAPALGLPVLVLRGTTERPEGVHAGTAKLVGTRREDIVHEAGRLLSDDDYYTTMSHAVNPYGDGQACERIAQAILHWAGRGGRPEDFTPAPQGPPVPSSPLDLVRA
jgi:UDP-N-acetylglucosamine 2-epimerase (non-hydrolysing)